MPNIAIEATGRVDERDSAFPQCIQFDDEEILCGFSVGGGQFVHGGTDWARSSDGGRSWRHGGAVLPATTDPISANYLKLTRSHDGETLFAYGLRYWGDPNDRFGERFGEPILCLSPNRGRTWSPPRVLPLADGARNGVSVVPAHDEHVFHDDRMGRARPSDHEQRKTALEISHSLLQTAGGSLLAPAATLAAPDRLGEEVFVGMSFDGGETWPDRSTVFNDPLGRYGYWEQKLAEVAPDVIMATAWTVTLGEYQDRPNSFALSRDGGRTWGAARSTGIMGQTMTPIPLGDDRLLVLYNRRYGRQGIVAALVTFTETDWTVHFDTMLYDAGDYRDRPQDGLTGVDELKSFAFGFPTGIQLHDGAILTTHWCVESGVCGIRWTRIRLEW